MPIIKIGKSRGEEFDFFYETFGHGYGNEKVILIHGFLTAGYKWKRQIEYFKQFYNEFEICVFDNRGVGSSGTPKSKFTTKEMALDILELMDHLGWDKVHVVGASMGGMVALELAHTAPKRIKSLVLAVTHAGSMPPLISMMNFTKISIENNLEKKTELLLELLYSPQFLNANKSSLMAEHIADATRDRKPTMAAELGHLRCVMTHKVSDKRLKEIKASKIPILIITGSLDNLVKTSNSHHLSKILEPVDFVVFEGCGHALHVEKNDDFNQCITKHFRQHSSNTTTNTITTTISSSS